MFKFIVNFFLEVVVYLFSVRFLSLVLASVSEPSSNKLISCKASPNNGVEIITLILVHKTGKIFVVVLDLTSSGSGSRNMSVVGEEVVQI